ncbi:TatD family hydrolase [Pseudomonas putida DOT-T1E]|uniref:TatD family hydrolase n=1 Tax=Pseudomonas putida (strain DOT-T1E) TaxID=1196325 RepID=I7C260_PSEPT|nr:TatD family hydrolase [Pseudomonas putida DOT-T1E]
MLVDSHCHLDRLDLSAHQGSLDAALQAARERGVGHFLCIGVSAENAGAVKALSEQYADVDCSVGVHPLDLAPGETPALEWLLRELAHPHVVAIGETGLDYHYEPEAAELQQASFRLHLEASRQTGKPVIVHTRAARADTLALLREASLPQAGVLHCFTEDWDMAKAALDLGYYISLSGIVTFRNADALREVARQVPVDRLLVETDSPYLAPIPHRGKPNLPQYVREVAEYVASLRGASYEQLAEQTTANFKRLFPLARAGHRQWRLRYGCPCAHRQRCRLRRQRRHRWLRRSCRRAVDQQRCPGHPPGHRQWRQYRHRRKRPGTAAGRGQGKAESDA